MAASSITPAQAELISSLTPDEVPIKLRCAICSKLAANAFRLPCCEQAICETCQSTLPSSCPVCEHTPLSADDCKPHKNLRTTIRVFLKTEEKKRGASQPKESRDSTPITPAEPKQAPAAAPTDKPEATDTPQATGTNAGAREDSTAAPSQRQTNGKDRSPNPEVQEHAEEDAHADQDDRDQREESEEVQIILHRNDNDLANGATDEQGPEPTQADDGDADENGAEGQQNGNFTGGFGFDSTNGQFPNFGTGDFNQMQMMMAMQSGMPFPMMGMGMDPMMMQNMQNMYMNGGFGSQGMGMSGMNMGMGGFNGGAGAGSDNNWNGQQSWNVGQDNYNHPNASGMGNGDYGSLNSGFHTGFNQGNFGHQGQFNDYRGNRYGYQRGGRFGRGGRGGYGFNRGGYGYGPNGNYSGQGPMANQYPPGMPGQTAGGPIGAGTNPADGVDEFGRTIRAGSAKDDENRSQPAGANEGGDAGADGEATEQGTGRDRGASDTGTPGASVKDGAAGATQSIPTLDDSRSTQNGEAVSVGDPSMRRFGPAAVGYRNFARGGSTGPVVPPVVPAPDVPINAPKGPKAMLQGLPNTSLLNLRARGFHVPGDKGPAARGQSPKTEGPVLPSPATDHGGSRSSSPGASRRREAGHYRERSKEHDRDADRSRDRSRERERRDKDRNRSRTPASSRARSRSRDHRDSRRRRRHRSQSASPDEREEDRHRRKHHRKHSSHADEGGDAKPRSRDDKNDERSRSASPGGSRQPGHRSRRDRQSRRRRDRGGGDEHERDDEHKHDAQRRSSHRSHRDRDYDRDDKDRDRDRERSTRDREKDRDRDRDRERRHRGSRRGSAEPPTPREPAADGGVFNPPTAPRSASISLSGAAKGLEIRGAASGRARDDGAPPAGPADAGRRPSAAASSSSSKAAGPSSSAAAAADPHAAEREARNRERLLRETQRLAGLAGLKRRGGAGGDDGDGADDGGGGGRRSRRKGRRGETVTADDDEARMRRLEAEREGPRWG